MKLSGCLELDLLLVRSNLVSSMTNMMVVSQTLAVVALVFPAFLKVDAVLIIS